MFKPMKFGIENGKVIMKPFKKREKREKKEIHYHYRFIKVYQNANVYPIPEFSTFPEREFVCWYCGKIHESEQVICSECGIEI